MTAIRTVDDFGFGFSWVYEEAMQRACHALADDGRVWLVDPVDEPSMLARAEALGAIAGVIQLLDRHNRDNAALATRYGVPLLRLPDAAPGTPFEAVKVLDRPGWHERALWWPARRTLVVAEVVGTGPFYVMGSEPAAIHPFLRLLPPGAPRRFDPEHLLVGHGVGVHGAPAAADAVRVAYARSRRDIPAALVRLPFRARG